MLDPRAHDVIAPFGLGGDLPVHRLGFGAMRITGPGIWGPPPNHDEAVAVLRRAVERGVNLIDTADSYGPFVSERLIAEALRTRTRRISSSRRRVGCSATARTSGVADGRPQAPARRVRSEHAASEAGTDPAVPVPPCSTRRSRSRTPSALITMLRDEGKIRHIGVCNVSEAQLDQVLAITPIVSVQNRYGPGTREFRVPCRPV